MAKPVASRPASSVIGRLRIGRWTRLGVVALGIVWLCAYFGLPTIVDQGNRFYAWMTAPEPYRLPDDLTHDERLMYFLSHVGGKAAVEAVEEIIAGNDQRFAAVLIEMLEANESPRILFGAGAHRHNAALEALTSQNFRGPQDERPELSDRWFLWYCTTDWDAPAGYTTWKGRLFSRFDPAFSRILRDGVPSDIRVEEIEFSGTKFDGVPTLDHPPMISAEAADNLGPREPVIGIVVDGDARAYPQRMLERHELVNDEIGGMPVLVSYCTLCGAAIAYDRRASDASTYTFGSSGLMYRSNQLLFDRETQSLWCQLSGRAVFGDLARTEPTLKTLPVVITRWDEWRQDHPDTTVLNLKSDDNRRYQFSGRLVRYYNSPETVFAVGTHSDALPLKSRVYGLTSDGDATAYPLDALASKKVVNDTVGQTPVVVIAQRGTIDVNSNRVGRGARSVPVQFNAGGEVQSYDRGNRTFLPGPDDRTVLDSQGKVWRVEDEALLGPEGEKLPRVGGVMAYWFGWYAFHEDTSVWEG